MSRKKQLLLGVLLSGWLGLAFIQWLTPTIWGADGYFHIRLAEMIKHQGLLKTLPQAQLSYFNDRFSDKDWLYHLLLIPFTWGGSIFAGAKWAAALGSCWLYASLVIVASFYTPWQLWPVAGVLFFASDHFLRTISEPRPVFLAIGLGLWIVHWLIQNKGKKVFLGSFIYGWLHITAPLVLVYGLIMKRWKLILIAGLGLLLAMIIYPNFPNNWFYFYLNGVLVPWFAVRWGVLELGAEFFPLSLRQYLSSYFIIPAGLAAMLVIKLRQKPKTSQNTQIWWLISAVFLIMGIKSQRYINHGYPFFILSLTSFLGDCSKKIKRWSNGAMLLGSIFICLMLGRSLQQMVLRGRSERFVNTHYEQMGNWLKDNVPKGELIFTANWSDPQYFIGINPSNNYFVVMDPVYMWHKDKNLYQQYRMAALGQDKDPYATLKGVFKVNYGYAGKLYFWALVDQVKKDSRFVIMKEDQLGIIFKLKK
jgi:hypothetical protein